MRLRTHKLNLCLAGALLWPALTGPALGAELGAETVQSLRYGVSLFHFYQRDYFDALTELMVGQSRDSLGPHAEGSELLRGGMSLSYGMDRLAEEIFTEQLASTEVHPDRDRAWFYLGKAAWQRGEVDRTLAALGAIGESAEEAVFAESQYLHASALMRTGQLDSALALLDTMPEDSKWSYYLQYNAAAQRAALGDWAAAQDHFSTFEDMHRSDSEHVALFERARTASGYAYLAADEPGAARVAFEQVSLDGAASEKALLGFGWAAVRQGDYLSALSAWQPLTERPMLYVTARESLMAVPYAYEQLGRSELALTQYRHASTVYAQQLADLETAIDDFREGSIGTLLGVGPASFEDAAVMGWLTSEAILPEGDYAPYLQFLVTRHGFQVALRELRDLYDMRNRLRDALSRLDVLREVDKHQQATWTEVITEDRQQSFQARALALQTRFAQLQSTVERAIAGNDSRALADAETRERWVRLDRAIQSAQGLERDDNLEQLRRLRGLQIWEDSERFPERAWLARRSLAAVASELQQSEERLEAVSDALEYHETSSAVARIDALQLGVGRQLETVERVITKAEAGTRQLAVAALEEQAEQLRRALGQSGLAVARLYDLNSSEVAR